MSTETKKIVISLAILNSMATQRAIFTSSVKELKDQTFRLDDIMITARDKQNETPDLENLNDNVNYIKAKYINVETKRSFVIPIRGLLGVQVAQLATDAAGKSGAAKKANFVKGTTPTMSVSEHIVENAVDGEMTLPQQFTVVAVENRKPLDGSSKPVYPAYYYAAYDVKAKEIADRQGDIAELYADRTFLNGLQGTELSPRYKAAEAIKEITIAI